MDIESEIPKSIEGLLEPLYRLNLFAEIQKLQDVLFIECGCLVDWLFVFVLIE